MIGGYSQVLANLPANRVAQFRGQIDRVYVLCYPDYQPPIEPHPQNNRAAFKAWRAIAGVPTWIWLNTTGNQAADAAVVAQLDAELEPDGWLIDNEGSWAPDNFSILGQAVAATGKPRIASLAATSASHFEYDYRTLDRLGFGITWQAYFDFGDGATPADAVRELYRSSFIIPGWQYRHRLSSKYGWGKVVRIEAGVNARLDSYLRPGLLDATFAVAPRAWGQTVVDGKLRRDGVIVGQLMGRCTYPRIRVSLDLTQHVRDAHEWTAIAASARYPGSAARPSDIYMLENATDDEIVAVAAGSG